MGLAFKREAFCKAQVFAPGFLCESKKTGTVCCPYTHSIKLTLEKVIVYFSVKEGDMGLISLHEAFPLSPPSLIFLFSLSKGSLRIVFLDREGFYWRRPGLY